MRSNLIRDAVIVLAAVLISALYVAAAGGNFPLDDSWIHQTYGRNLAQLGEWAFIPGVPSAASTSALYTAVLSLGYRLGMEPRLWAHGIGVLALALTGLVGARMAEQVLPRRGEASLRLSLATGLALVLAWHLVWAAVSGMETMIFCLFTLVLIWLAWREMEPRPQTTRALALRGAIFGGAAALATLTRPEGVLLAGLVGLALLVARPNMTWRGLIVWGGAALIVFVLMLAPYLIMNLRLTGGLLPNTAAAKRGESAGHLAQPFLWRLVNVTTPLTAGVQLLLVPGMLAFLATLERNRKAALLVLPLVWSAALIVLYAVTLPLEFQHGRYVIPVLPSAITVGVIGTAWLLRRARGSMIGRVLTRGLAATAAVILLICAFVLGLQAYVQDVRVIDQEMVATALWIRDHLPPEDLLVTHDIGAVGYFASRPILDIAGLVSPEVVPLMQDPEGMWAYIRERGGKYLEAMDDQVPGRNVDDPRLCVVYRSGGEATVRAGGSRMTVYRLNWDGVPCG